MKQSTTYRIAVIGLGYVGLPLAKLFLERGHTVYGIDLDERKLDKLNKHQPYLSDFTRAEMKEMFARGTFHAGSSFEVISETDVVIICVPTPLNEQAQPDLTYVTGAMRSCLPYLHVGQLIVLESSTYPGTTEDELQPLIESRGFEIGKHISLAYSPERIDPGQKAFPLHSIPKIVGGVTPRCTAFAEEVYGSAFDRVVLVSSPRTAEMTKLLENCQRFVNISFMNELLPLCEEMNINLWEVVAAASTKPYGFTPYYPGPGIGGHCIPIDPLYLLWKARTLNQDIPFIERSHEVNEAMPAYVVERVKKSLQGIPLSESSVLVVGVTYKKDVNDLRDSTAIPIIKQLAELGVLVNYYDPYFDQLQIGDKIYKSLPLTAKNVKKHKCTLILTDHSNLPYNLIVAHSSIVIDTRNATSKLLDRSNVIML
ncbi:nucleotide sugar dehydrogenase [Paenibacillus radicis (ex Xue et al. 2023)]|uniref:Nucleotide sugar dehydrogenase n=1 Tax=Paenibacillus radicis (ex Xue et al. 2023) TaxID=2972489 RepID=A0ABT1YSC6_9BACL|nr:nucleotide sugar dehydrogenase [Paenibacillus radicis (ex Xue et al. 2023)]MCR8636079.1 nucleotide sugar dehydrogenase [Paenibacillus radicis (ex Xue et al. 2023)]